MDLDKEFMLKQQAEKSKRQLASVISASPMPIYLLNSDQQITDCNRPFCALFGLDLSKVKGKRVDEVASFDDEFKTIEMSFQTVEL